jgi:ABC-type transport system involved in cytochrome c biogenesis permease subunit
MPIEMGYAHYSDTLFTTAIAIYSGALVSYCGEYAFGRRGRIAETSRATDRALAAVGAPGDALVPEPSRPADDLPAEQPAGRDRAERFGRLALGLTILGLVVHALSVVLRGVAADRPPWGNMYEFTSAVGVVAVTAFLVVLVRQPALRYLGMFVMLPVIILMFLAGTVLYAKAAPLVPALRSYWLAIHVSAAITATGIFLVSFVATLLYLVRERWDRVAFAFPIWTFGIIAGAIWAEAAWSRYWGWDPKETWAFIAWVIYACYLHARATAGWRGSRAGWINLAAFSAMLFNLFVVNMVISGLHSYAGLS